MKIKVLHICIGFGNIIYNELFNKFADENIEQFVFYPRRKTEKSVDFSKYNYSGCDPLIHKKYFSFAYPLKVYIYFRSLKKHLKSKSNFYNTIHAHTLFSAGAIAFFIKKRYPNLKYIVAIRSTDEEYIKKKPYLKLFGKKIIENSEKIICISYHLKKKILKTYQNKVNNLEDKIIVIPNGINNSFFESYAQPKKRLKDMPIKFLYVGSFIKRKRVLNLIKFSEKYDYELTIIGDGGKEQKKVLNTSMKNSNITFLGKITDKEKLIEKYKENDIFIMLSYLETFGLVYIESISQGTPIIYSKNSGVDGFFPEGTIGYSVEPNNLNDINEKTQLILENYSEISCNCINKSKNFNWDEIAQKYIQLYNNILEKK